MGFFYLEPVSTVYVIASSLGDHNPQLIPQASKEKILALKTFVVEDIRNARRFLRKLDPKFDIDGSTFIDCDKRTKADDLLPLIVSLSDGSLEEVGLLSEVGAPGVADPGALLIELAHQNSITVKPLIGPSSILLSLMASGLNGQAFEFHGYLPVDPRERKKKIQSLEAKSRNSKATQLFIETPYRNKALFDDLIKVLSGTTQLCLAVNLTLEGEWVKTKSISDWKSGNPEIHKNPCVFLIKA